MRRQTLAQMALGWTLRDPRITSTLVGASSVEQLEQNLAALERLDFSTRSWPRSTARAPGQNPGNPCGKAAATLEAIDDALAGVDVQPG